MKSVVKFGSGAQESFPSVIWANCHGYFDYEGVLPEVVQVSPNGRFSEHIGEEAPITLRDGTEVTVKIIGGGTNIWLHGVGLL